jgi:hypothetical protein
MESITEDVPLLQMQAVVDKSGNTTKTKSSVRFSDDVSAGYGSVSGSEDLNHSISVSPDGKSFATHYAATPKLNRDSLEYKKPSERPQQVMASNHGSISKPNYEDMLRRVSIVIQQHIAKCEKRLKKARDNNTEGIKSGLFYTSQGDKFDEKHYLSPQYMYHFVRAPICRLGFLYGIREVEEIYTIPDISQVHQMLIDLFLKAQLSAECSIVCLIYVERLMETANVPLLKTTWKPVVMAAMLLASKVWQDLSSWNIEFSQIYPQYNISSINSLEKIFCQEIEWNLYISPSSYAKYYFALRSLNERNNFRQNFVMASTGGFQPGGHNAGGSGSQHPENAPNAQQVSERSVGIKEELLSTVLSKSL